MTGGSAKKTNASGDPAGTDPSTEFSPASNSGLESSCYERSRGRKLGGKMRLAQRLDELDPYVAWLAAVAWESE